jgi:hypothetical protein
MRKLFVFALVALFPLVAHAQPTEVSRATLATVWDLDGEAADDDQVIGATNLVDNGTSVGGVNYTILAQPDTCRLIDITVTDADSSLTAGAITIAGTDCLGAAKSCSFTFAAGGTGVKSLTCTDGQGAYFSNIATVTTNTLTGEAAGDTVKVGYTSNSVNGWPMYGRVSAPNAYGSRSVDPFGYFDVPVRVTTSGSPSTTLAAVTASSAPFANVSVGDLIVLQLGGTEVTRKVTAKASNDSLTLSDKASVPAVGQAFRVKKFYFSTNPADLVYIPVHGFRTALIDWSVDANANTGGVVMLLQCTQERVEFPAARWVDVKTTTVASAATQANTSESIDLSLLPYSYCRIGFKFGTGDDADAAAEDINASFTLYK